MCNIDKYEKEIIKDIEKDISFIPLFREAHLRSRLYSNLEKRHRCASCDLKASFTVEAAVVLPIFIFITVFLLIFFRILTVSWGVEVSLQDVSRQSAILSDTIGSFRDDDGGSTKGDGVEKATLVGFAQAAFKKNKLQEKFIKGGALGINMLASEVTDREIDLIASYKVELPISFFGNKFFYIIQRAKVKKWVGYDPLDGGEEEEKVYVTKHGSAYHSRIDCVYLSPSISMTSAEEISAKRNESGGKYYPCEKCGKKGGSLLYITDYGTAYHTSASCSSLSRSVQKIKKEKAIESGYHACSKCGG